MFYHLVFMGKNGVIGLGNKPPWYRKRSTQRYYPELTKDHSMIMSEKSFNNFAYHKYVAKKIILVSQKICTLKDAMTQTQDEEPVFIAGGKSLYAQTMHMVHGIYLIKIFKNFIGNVFYPNIPADMHFKYAVPNPNDDDVVFFYYERSYDQIMH